MATQDPTEDIATALTLLVGSTSNAVQKSVKDKKKKNKKRGGSKAKNAYSTYLRKVLRQVHPNIGVTKKTMIIMNSFVGDIFDRLSNDASSIVQHSGRSTMQARDMMTACRLVIPGELAKHAVSEGTKAVNRFNSDK